MVAPRGSALTWPPEKMTGVEAGLGRYGMVAPFGGDWRRAEGERVGRRGCGESVRETVASSETRRGRCLREDDS